MRNWHSQIRDPSHKLFRNRKYQANSIKSYCKNKAEHVNSNISADEKHLPPWENPWKKNGHSKLNEVSSSSTVAWKKGNLKNRTRNGPTHIPKKKKKIGAGRSNKWKLNSKKK